MSLITAYDRLTSNLHPQSIYWIVVNADRRCHSVAVRAHRPDHLSSMMIITYGHLGSLLGTGRAQAPCCLQFPYDAFPS